MSETTLGVWWLAQTQGVARRLRRPVAARVHSAMPRASAMSCPASASSRNSRHFPSIRFTLPPGS